ncbi:hypothetical protein B0T19DRAFT_467249 [Cercophora scortea]|uniref:Protein kinase domain-containing protein n=1 Tax=Cercophora scortea TaxID=314031 RepID=A0AAE0I6W8_9PEZI|nr:hypothetical protein B0T19DRAFT_467249 [Cercophora scortea]
MMGPAKHPLSSQAWTLEEFELGKEISFSQARAASASPESARAKWLQSHQKHTVRAVLEPRLRAFLLETSEGELTVVRSVAKASDSEYKDPNAAKDLNLKAFKYSSPIPPELRFTRLQDKQTQVLLPDEPYFPELHAFQTMPGESRLMFYKVYNGGSLWNLIKRFAEWKGTVPEPLIWHVMEQLTRAIIFLAAGLTREDLQKGNRRPHSKYKKIVHRDILASNILLDFPQQKTTDYGSGDADLGDLFPRVILANWQNVGREGDQDKWNALGGFVNSQLARRGAEQLPDHREDIYCLGRVLRLMVKYKDHWEQREENKHDIDHDPPYLEDWHDKNWKSGDRPYSNQLINLLMEFETQKGIDGTMFDSEVVRKKQMLDRVKDVNFLIDTVLPAATKRVSRYRRDLVDQIDEEKLRYYYVRWAMPGPDYIHLTAPQDGAEQDEEIASTSKFLKPPRGRETRHWDGDDPGSSILGDYYLHQEEAGEEGGSDEGEQQEQPGDEFEGDEQGGQEEQQEEEEGEEEEEEAERNKKSGPSVDELEQYLSGSDEERPGIRQAGPKGLDPPFQAHRTPLPSDSSPKLKSAAEFLQRLGLSGSAATPEVNSEDERGTNVPSSPADKARARKDDQLKARNAQLELLQNRVDELRDEREFLQAELEKALQDKEDAETAKEGAENQARVMAEMAEMSNAIAQAATEAAPAEATSSPSLPGTTDAAKEELRKLRSDVRKLREQNRKEAERLRGLQAQAYELQKIPSPAQGPRPPIAIGQIPVEDIEIRKSRRARNSESVKSLLKWVDAGYKEPTSSDEKA